MLLVWFEGIISFEMSFWETHCIMLFIPDDDKTSMALTTTRCFQLVGFTKKQNTPLHIFLRDSAHYIVPRNDVGVSLCVYLYS